jgi:hypothetical protein
MLADPLSQSQEFTDRLLLDMRLQSCSAVREYFSNATTAAEYEPYNA